MSINFQSKMITKLNFMSNYAVVMQQFQMRKLLIEINNFLRNIECVNNIWIETTISVIFVE